MFLSYILGRPKNKRKNDERGRTCGSDKKIDQKYRSAGNNSLSLGLRLGQEYLVSVLVESTSSLRCDNVQFLFKNRHRDPGSWVGLALLSEVHTEIYEI